MISICAEYCKVQTLYCAKRTCLCLSQQKAIISIKSLNRSLFIMQKMGVYCEMGSELMCTSELYKSKSSVVFLKQMLICHPKSGFYVTLLTQPSQDYLQNFHPKNPPSVIQPFFTSLPSKHKHQPKRSRLSSPAYPSSPFPSIFRLQEGTVVTAWRLSNKILHGSFFGHKCTAFIYNSSPSFPPFPFLLLKKSTSQTSAKIYT